MELHEIHADSVVIEVTDEVTGEVFRRELPIEFYENANFLRLTGSVRLSPLNKRFLKLFPVYLKEPEIKSAFRISHVQKMLTCMSKTTM